MFIPGNFVTCTHFVWIVSRLRSVYRLDNQQTKIHLPADIKTSKPFQYSVSIFRTSNGKSSGLRAVTCEIALNINIGFTIVNPVANSEKE